MLTDLLHCEAIQGAALSGRAPSAMVQRNRVPAMSQSAFDFRKIENPSGSQRSEQLFRASASAFASLTRPTKLDIQQFEELSDALYDRVSDEAKRYVAAILASNAHAPAAVIRRLANEAPAIAAPVLAQSPALAPAALVALIARHGDGHARVIAKRADLDPAIRALVALLIRDAQAAETVAARSAPDATAQKQRLVASADDVRTALRATMASNNEPAILPPNPAPSREKLLARLMPTALSGRQDFFRTALADVLDVPFSATARIIEENGATNLLFALRVLAYPVAEAFMIAACLNPGRYLSTHTIHHFAERYEALTLQAARDWLDDFRASAFDEAGGDRTPGMPVATDIANQPLPLFRQAG